MNICRYFLYLIFMLKNTDIVAFFKILYVRKIIWLKEKKGFNLWKYVYMLKYILSCTNIFKELYFAFIKEILIYLA